MRQLRVYPSPPSARNRCPDAVGAVSRAQVATLDPTGSRTRLFDKANPDSAHVGDVLLVRTRAGDAFAGVLLNVRRRGVDTAVLLRGQMTRVGVEMWFKVYSPLVEGIEVVQRREKRARRERLYYMRLKKHDRGSVENVVQGYLRKKAALGVSSGRAKLAGKDEGRKRGIAGRTGKKGKRK